MDLPIQYQVRDIADPEKALETIEEFAKGKGGQQEALRQVVGMFRKWVKPPLDMDAKARDSQVRDVQSELMKSLMR